jgi:hypothetical protein
VLRLDYVHGHYTTWNNLRNKSWKGTECSLYSTVTPNMAALPHKTNTSAETSRDGSGTQESDKRKAVSIIQSLGCDGM